MNRVIRGANVGPAPIYLDSNATRFVDGEMADLVEQARRAAYEAGYRDGYGAGSADNTAAAARVAGALDSALRAASQLRSETIVEALQAALAVAEHVVGTAPPTSPEVLVERIEQAIETLDDEAIVVSLSPGDWDQVAPTVSLPPNVTVDQDPTLTPGEARIRGTWSSIDLTRAAALDVVRRVLA